MSILIMGFSFNFNFKDMKEGVVVVGHVIKRMGQTKFDDRLEKHVERVYN